MEEVWLSVLGAVKWAVKKRRWGRGQAALFGRNALGLWVHCCRPSPQALPATAPYRAHTPLSLPNPAGLLADPSSVRSLGGLVGPIVRAVDALVGEQVAMLVEVEFQGAKGMVRLGAAAAARDKHV